MVGLWAPEYQLSLSSHQQDNSSMLLCPVFVVVVLFCVFTWGLGTEVRISLGQEKFLGVFRIISLFWAVYLDAFPRITIRLAPDTSQIKPKESLSDAASLVASFLPIEWDEQYGFTHPHEFTRPSGFLRTQREAWDSLLVAYRLPGHLWTSWNHEQKLVFLCCLSYSEFMELLSERLETNTEDE